MTKARGKPIGAYVYAYVMPCGTPYYIGKGRGGRAWDKKTHRVEVPPLDQIWILRDGMSDGEALEQEKAWISCLGLLIDGAGPLQNLSYGGEGWALSSSFARNRRIANGIWRRNYQELASFCGHLGLRMPGYLELVRAPWRKRPYGRNGCHGLAQEAYSFWGSLGCCDDPDKHESEKYLTQLRLEVYKLFYQRFSEGFSPRMLLQVTRIIDAVRRQNKCFQDVELNECECKVAKYYLLSLVPRSGCRFTRNP